MKLKKQKPIIGIRHNNDLYLPRYQYFLFFQENLQIVGQKRINDTPLVPNPLKIAKFLYFG